MSPGALRSVAHGSERGSTRSCTSTRRCSPPRRATACPVGRSTARSDRMICARRGEPGPGLERPVCLRSRSSATGKAGPVALEVDVASGGPSLKQRGHFGPASRSGDPRSRRPGSFKQRDHLVTPAAVNRVDSESLRSKLATVLQDDSHPCPARSVWHERKPIDVRPGAGWFAVRPYPPPYDDLAGADLDAPPPGVQAHARENNSDQRTRDSPCRRNVRVECSPRSEQEDEAAERRDCGPRSARSDVSDRSGTTHRLPLRSASFSTCVRSSRRVSRDGSCRRHHRIVGRHTTRSRRSWHVARPPLPDRPFEPRCGRSLVV